MISHDPAKLRRDVLWSAGGLAVTGLAGVVLNTLIGRLYGSAGLGVFNQVFAAYIVASQVAALGVHQSVMRSVAQANDADEQGKIIAAGLVVGAPLAGATALVFWLVAPLVARVLNSPAVLQGMHAATLGLALFGVNKIALGALNGLRHMHAVALLQSARFVTMLAGLGACVQLELPAGMVPGVLSLAEVVVLMGAVLHLLIQSTPMARPLGAWPARHLRFGAKSFLGGVLVELNTRVDVLVLGVFAADALVGVYSFAAIFAEGFFQLLVVLRNTYNPVLARLLAVQQTHELHRFMRAARPKIYLTMGALAFASTAFFAWGMPALVGPELAAGWYVFAILATGIVVVAGYIPFDQVLLLAGLPGWHTLGLGSAVLVNVVGNVVLIPLLGAAGAAAATGLSLGYWVLLVRHLARWLASVRM